MSPHSRRKKEHFARILKLTGISFAIVAFITFLFSTTIMNPAMNWMARYSWKTLHNEKLSLSLERTDDTLPMQIGDYYFGGTTYDTKKALEAYRFALKINPDMLWAHYQIGRLLFIGSNFKGALDELAEEQYLHNGNYRTLYMMGLVNAYQNKYTVAEHNFETFVSWAPTEWAGYNDLAWVLSLDGKYKEAEMVSLKAFINVQDSEKNPWLWNSIGIAQLNLGKNKEAQHSFEAAALLATNLTLEEMNKAYPGNNPSGGAVRLRQFRDAIQQNILTSSELSKTTKK